MTKMAVMPIYGQNTLYVSSGTQAHHSLFNDDLGLTLTYFMPKSKFVTWAFL